MKGVLTLIFIISLHASTAYAQYYQTLPEGVRVFSIRNVKSNVESSYNKSQSESPYKYEVNADINALEDVENQIVEDTLELFKAYPEAYKRISLGKHIVDGKAEVNADVFGIGYGITNKITAYIGFPIYKANVRVRYKRVNNSSEDEVAAILQEEYGDNWAQTLGNIVEKLVAVDETIIQSALVNTLGYDELGDWSGEGIGDTEMGVMYNFLTRENYGALVSVGLVAPTGYVDDPDLLQDIGFGDGQWDAFLELGGSYHFSPSVIGNIWSRYTYQQESTKELRVPYSEDVFLSDNKQEFTEKLGNKLLYGYGVDIAINDWFKVAPSMIYSKTEKANYDSDNKLANEWLAESTDSFSQSLRFQTQISSVKLFQKGKFLIPGQFNFAIQKMLEGKNTPKVDLIDLEFRMFF